MKNQIQKSSKLNKNLTLTGMMGAGKSTIGKKLAKKLKYDFFDVDDLIEIEEGTSINLIFKNKSESYFRKLENEITLDVLKKKNSVISLGGGAFLNKLIRASAKDKSVSFWLDVEITQLIKRLNRAKRRPLLYKKNISATVKKIYLDREKIYSKADYRIKCNSLKTSEIVNKILKLYENSGN
jgi:shikimate kinase